MEGDDLGTEEVLARSEVGQGNAVLATVGDEVVNSPLAVCVALLSELDPHITRTVGGSRSNVGKDGTVVGLGDDVVRRAGVVVVPLKGDLVTTLDLDRLSRSRVVDVASHGLGGNISDGVVVGRRADVATGGVSKTLGDIVDEDVKHSGVGRSHGGSSQSENSGSLHCDDLEKVTVKGE